MVRSLKIGSVTTLSILLILLAGCMDEGSDDGDEIVPVEPREAMRELVINISTYANGIDDGFIIITQNGNELLFLDKDLKVPEVDYVNSIDGVAQEDLFFGYEKDNRETPAIEREYLLGMLRKARELNRTVLVTDYCRDRDKVDTSYEMNGMEGFISFTADRRELDDIPLYPDAPNEVNGNDIWSLSDAKNFLYLIDPERYPEREAYLGAIRGTDFDLLILDLFHEGTELTAGEVASLKKKVGGGERLVLCYMSIGEAEDYRYYWRSEWKNNPPGWLDNENPEWEGNYKVHYWDSDWQGILYGNNEAYLDRIMGAGFDGVYLDIIDAFEYYER
ncbi:MAG: endo alpha-1,4 polygalactosaminidase [Candidatus Thermoplasmatota archaeon]|jgi:cysteinyl-tRNA synthetase|nr:endo alpha-1,4 polygalactosaminidase [Candidatus Thermoplasmatota archaeon]